MYYKNLNVLKKKSIPFYNLVHSSKVEEYKSFGIDFNKRDIDIYIKNKEHKTYITSANYKAAEAKVIVDDLLKDGHDEVVLFGVGNKELLEEVTSRVDKNTKLHIIEFKEVFRLLVENVSLTKVAFEKVTSLVLYDENTNMRAIFERMTTKSNMSMRVLVLPQYERHLKKQVEAFTSVFKRTLDDKKRSMVVNKSYQKIWIYNSIINFKHVLSTPKFMSLHKYDFQESVALIVGAGPSLSYEVDRLKEITKRENAYVFPIGSAYKALANEGIGMDMLFSYDPTPLNKDVLNEYFEQKYEVPLCFGSSISYESVKRMDYDNAYHILTSQDYFSSYLLEGTNREIVMDAPSIVVVAIQALLKIGFKKFIFVGQNLAFLDKKNYAESITYERTKNITYESDMVVKDVFGNDIYTVIGYSKTKDLLENLISQLNGIEFINTTYGGADIKGAPYVPLNEIDFSKYRKIKEFDIGRVDNNYDLHGAKKGLMI